MQPDAGAPGMNLEIQFVGNNFGSTTTVTTDSSDIVVGPVLVYDQSGDVVTTGGSVLKTVFFISGSASVQSVEVTVGPDILLRNFEIIPITGTLVGSGDYSAAAPGLYTLGNDQGINGNRTIGGTTVLDSLIVPVGVILNVTAQDIDLTRSGNQGFLPAIILVDGEVDIQGTILINGSNGFNFTNPQNGQGGQGGPGGGGGGAAGRTCSIPGCAGGGNDAARGGHGFSGGGGGGIEATTNGGDGGDGTGIAGDANAGTSGGDGGYGLYGNTAQNGTGGADDGTGGDAGAGGSGWPFGLGGDTGTYAGGVTTPQGIGGGGGGGSNSESDGGGGGGFGRAGEDASGLGGGALEAGQGGAVTGNNQMVPFSGGSGGGGGSPDTGGDTRVGGGGGGAGGALLIYSTGNMTIRDTGKINADGGKGGDASMLIGLGCCAGSGGGGGSGGGIMLQAQNVTVRALGTLTAIGGVNGTTCKGCFDVPPSGTQPGDGGDGRIRVDGVPASIGGTIPVGPLGGGPVQYVGPAITAFNGTHLIGTGNSTANVNATIQNGIGPMHLLLLHLLHQFLYLHLY